MGKEGVVLSKKFLIRFRKEEKFLTMKDNTFDQKERKIVNEILNDAFWLSFILELKRNISDLYQKEILSNFLIFFFFNFCRGND